jgi:hypothetical protein
MKDQLFSNVPISVTLVGGQITERFISGQMVDVAGIEPATPCLQSRCSPS